MPRSTSRHPTDAELEILTILWSRGPSTVRQVQEQLNEAKPRAYTSIMTLMSIMHRKGYLRCRKAPGGYIYSAKRSAPETGRGMLRDLVQRAFSGSPMAAMLSLLDERELNDDELRQLRQMLDRKLAEREDQ
jgi:predicted transcriptional regulator